MPNTAIALRLARALEVAVEDLFSLAPVAPPAAQVTLLPHSDRPHSGDPMQLCRVDRQIMGLSPSPAPWYLPTADGVLIDDPGRAAKATVQPFHTECDFDKRILIAGCDPGIPVLARHVLRAGMKLVVAQRNSSPGVGAAEAGRDPCGRNALARPVERRIQSARRRARLFGRKAVAVISLAVWEEGLVVARKESQVDPFGRRPGAAGHSRIVNREPGAGSRMLLDAQLDRLGIVEAEGAQVQALGLGHL